MAGVWDFLFNGQGLGGGGLLPPMSDPSSGTGMFGMPSSGATDPMTAAAPPAPPPTPAPTQSRFPVIGAALNGLGSSLGSGGFMTNLTNYFQNNPNTIDALAAGLSSAPNLRSGISNAAGAMGQARTADQQSQGRTAIQSYLRNPANLPTLSQEQRALLVANPDLAMPSLGQMLGFTGTHPATAAEHAKWGIPESVPLEIDNLNGEPKVISSSQFALNFNGTPADASGAGGAPPTVPNAVPPTAGAQPVAPVVFPHTASDTAAASGAPTQVASAASPAPAVQTGSGRIRSLTPAEAAAHNIPPDQAASYQIDQATGKVEHVTGTSIPAAGSTLTPEEIAALGDAIHNHKRSPVTTGLYKNGGLVGAYIAQKYPEENLAQEQNDWTATQAHLKTMNNQQQTQMREAIQLLNDQLPRLQAMADQWNAGQFPDINKVRQAITSHGLADPSNPQKSQAAQSLLQQMQGLISEMTPELAKVYSGGNASTDAQLAHADQQLSTDWSLQTLTDMIKLAQSNLSVRQNTLNTLGTGNTPNNPYDPTPPPAAAPAVNDPLGIR